MRLLVVTAVAAERDSAARGLLHTLVRATDPVSLPGYELERLTGAGSPDPHTDLLAAGVGPAAAAAGASAALTAAALAGEPYGLVLSAGIGGGFQPAAPVGSVVVADAIIAADLG